MPVITCTHCGNQLALTEAAAERLVCPVCDSEFSLATTPPPMRPERPTTAPDSRRAERELAEQLKLLALLAPPQEPLELGRMGPYRIRKILGRGGMGVVFQGDDAQLHRPVAIKVMLPALDGHDQAAQRFQREARAMAAIDHPAITRVYQVGEDRGIPYLAMELLQGVSLADRLKRPPALSVDEVTTIGRQVADGLAAAHAAGLIHRDIKPANLWLDRRTKNEVGSDVAPSPLCVKLLDFGLVRLIDPGEQITQSGDLLGSPAYMSPEQARGEKVDHRSDLFSLGVVLYQMATGSLPFQRADAVSLLVAIASEAPPPARSLNPAIPTALDALIAALLAKDPRQRPQTAAAVRDTLADITPAGTPPRRHSKSRRWLFSAAAIGAIAVVGFAASYFADLSPRKEANEAPARNPSETVDDVRQVSKALALGGRAVVVVENKEVSVAQITEIPKIPFRVVELFFERCKNLSDADLDSLGPAPFLKRLQLNETPIGDAAMDALAKYPSLIQLHLNYTRVTDRGLAKLRPLVRLEFLDLSNNLAITDAGLEPLGALDKLDHICLQYTGVKDLAPLAKLERLVHLELTGSPIADAALRHLANSRQLRQLHIGYTPLGDAGVAHLVPLTQLDALYAPSTRITDAGTKSIAKISGLRDLNLKSTNISDAGLFELKALVNLHDLNVAQTKVSNAGIAELRKSLRDCAIVGP